MNSRLEFLYFLVSTSYYTNFHGHYDLTEFEFQKNLGLNQTIKIFGLFKDLREQLLLLKTY